VTTEPARTRARAGRGGRARDLIRAGRLSVSSSFPMARRSLLPLLSPLLAALACTDRDAPRPVPVPDSPAAGDARPLSTREAIPPAPAAAVDPDDPAEPGISDLARLARYVFRTMQQHEGVCPFDNPLRDQLHFALAIEVKGGRMVRVGLGHVGVEPEGATEARTLAKAQWPRELTAYVACLGPHLRAVAMAPSPADGAYEPAYSFGGQPAGRPAP
jgi:hypothetical protein